MQDTPRPRKMARTGKPAVGVVAFAPGQEAACVICGEKYHMVLDLSSQKLSTLPRDGREAILPPCGNLLHTFCGDHFRQWLGSVYMKQPDFSVFVRCPGAYGTGGLNGPLTCPSKNTFSSRLLQLFLAQTDPEDTGATYTRAFNKFQHPALVYSYSCPTVGCHVGTKTAVTRTITHCSYGCGARFCTEGHVVGQTATGCELCAKGKMYCDKIAVHRPSFESLCFKNPEFKCFAENCALLSEVEGAAIPCGGWDAITMGVYPPCRIKVEKAEGCNVLCCPHYKDSCRTSVFFCDICGATCEATTHIFDEHHYVPLHFEADTIEGPMDLEACPRVHSPSQPGPGAWIEAPKTRQTYLAIRRTMQLLRNKPPLWKTWAFDKFSFIRLHSTFYPLYALGTVPRSVSPWAAVSGIYFWVFSYFLNRGMSVRDLERMKADDNYIKDVLFVDATAARPRELSGKAYRDFFRDTCNVVAFAEINGQRYTDVVNIVPPSHQYSLLNAAKRTMAMAEKGYAAPHLMRGHPIPQPPPPPPPPAPTPQPPLHATLVTFALRQPRESAL